MSDNIEKIVEEFLEDTDLNMIMPTGLSMESQTWWDMNTVSFKGIMRRKLTETLAQAEEEGRKERNEKIGNAIRRLINQNGNETEIAVNDLLNFAEHLNPIINNLN